jgi:peptide-methionine (S)-S-oxide reductase
VSTRVGYAGGTTLDPTYLNIGDHTESVEVVYDPSQISYEDLLSAFWNGHSPTVRPYSNQYRSIIFYYNDTQRALAEADRDRLQAEKGHTIYTAIIPAAAFYPAEDYHQKYYLKSSPTLADAYRAIYPDENDFTNSTATARVNGYRAGYGDPEVLKAELSGLGLTPAGQELLLELSHGLTPACPLPD